jgi:glycosyltransferase involved in cell wall biosynthesis
MPGGMYRMAKADLHVHSCYSSHPSEWFLKRLGTQESYTDPEMVYQTAKRNGMDFVTITDHNQIDGAMLLVEKYPDDTFTGVEVTTYFPENGCKIHLLVYGLSRDQFAVIDTLRTDIYRLRDYIKQENLPHAVAHATFSINNKLSLEYIERLMLLFDFFEGINGTRTAQSNMILVEALKGLTRSKIKELSRSYGIEPYSDTSWIKELSGGSDDHSGLFIGKSWTEVDARSPEEFLDHFRAKKALAGGRHNNYQGFAFAIYKIAYDFSKTKSRNIPHSLFKSINKLLFEGEGLSLKNKIALKRFGYTKNGKNDFKHIVANLLDEFEKMQDCTVEEKVERVYDRLAEISDELLSLFLGGISQTLKEGDLIGFFRNISGSIPAVFLALPFFTTLSVLYSSRHILDELLEKYGNHHDRKKKKILWFTDTLTDLNGVSETIQKLGWLAGDTGYDLQVVSCLLTEEVSSNQLPPNVLVLPHIFFYTPSFFNTYTLRVPSCMRSIKMVCELDPDEILISTPGPVGLLGMLVARLLHIPCRSIFHTDFSAQAYRIIGDEAVCRFVDDYLRWFYAQGDTMYVPTKVYMDDLERRGYERKKMVLFRRGIDKKLFSPHKDAREYIRDYYGIREGVNLFYAGRISKEKSIDFLGELYCNLLQEYPDCNLLLAGEGPYLNEFRAKMSDSPAVYFLGRVPRKNLPLLYSASDLFVFPSLTDTFGMVVLEAQACGLPAVVSNIGGPKEIILNGKTGFIANAHDLEDWKNKLEGIVGIINTYPELYFEMRVQAREHVCACYDWTVTLDTLFSQNPNEHTVRKRFFDSYAGHGIREQTIA